jgi:uncharacterized membrane protein
MGNAASVADLASAFVERAKRNEKPAVLVKNKHLESFAFVVMREGISLAKDCLEAISDPEVRRILEALFFGTAAGAAIGATVGIFVAGPPGAQVGAAVGAGVGFLSACVALTITAEMRGDRVLLKAV